MNMGVPVIVTKSHGITDDYVINNYNGLVINKVKKDLLNALDKIYSDENLYHKLCENGKIEFENNYTYYAMGKNIGKILESI